MNELKSLEHPTLKVPYEVFNKRYRGAQRILDVEARQIAGAAAEIETAVNEDAKAGKIVSLIDGMYEKLNTMKRKATEAVNEELQIANNCKKRLDHVKEMAGYLAEPETPQIKSAMSQWRKTRLDRMLVDYCLRMGHYETARKLADAVGIRELTNVDIYSCAAEVEAALAARRPARCLLWCADHKSKLRKIGSNMEFKIRIQEFVELVREDKRIEAVKYARRHLSHYEEGQLEEIQQCCGMLAFPKDTEVEPYKSLLAESRRAALVAQFRASHARLLHPAPLPALPVACQLGLAALNTCYSSTSRSASCPACQPPLSALARQLPLAHCTRSRLVCRASRLPLDERNQPMALPNGQVYGEQALKEMMKEHGAIICPKTKEVFCMKRVEKVYVM